MEFAFLKQRGIDRGYLPPHERRSSRMRPGDQLITPDLRIQIIEHDASIRATVRSETQVRSVALPSEADPKVDSRRDVEIEMNGCAVRFRLELRRGANSPEYNVTVPDRKYGWVTGPNSNLYPREAEAFACLNRAMYAKLSNVARELIVALDREIEIRTHGRRPDVLRSLCASPAEQPATLNILRTLYYPECARGTFEGTAPGTKLQHCGPHNDVAAITVMTAPSAGSLEVLTQDEAWLGVVPDEEALYVIAGDTLRLITQDLMSHDGSPLKIEPTTHRVTGTIETATRPRTANVLFVNLDLTREFRSPVTYEVIRNVDPTKNIDVELQPALRLLHARLQANGTLGKQDTFLAFAQRAAN